MKKFTFTFLPRLLGLVFLWMNLGHAPDLHAQTPKTAQDFATRTLTDAGNNLPTAIWSDGTTMWVADFANDTIYAYDLVTKARDVDKDFDNLIAAGNNSPLGLWSDDITMWVADGDDGTLYAYNLATKARDASKDFTLATENASPRGIWSNGTTMWVADYSDGKIYAYNLATKARDADKDFALAMGEDSPLGIWSNGTTMWVADEISYEIYAYNLATKARDGDYNTFALATGNDNPYGLWSDGTTMWVLDDFDIKLYAYTFPKKNQTITFTLPPSVLGDTLDLPATASSGLEVSYVSSDPSIAEVGTGMNANKLFLKAVGNATITASQEGNDRYVATDVSHDIAVLSRKLQFITFTLSEGVMGDTLDLSAISTVSSGLEIIYVSSDPSIAEVGIGMNAGKLILKALGDAIITASQAGNTEYSDTFVSHTITVSTILQQTITFTLSGTGMLGDTLDLSATASSGLEVTYVSSDSSIAEVGTGMNAGKLILKTLGNATITASQEGNDRYATVPDVTQDIIVNKKDQTITFTLSGTGMLGDTLDLSATASSGLEVTYVSSDSSIAEVGTGMNAGKLILKTLGNATITASQEGNDRYATVPDVTQDIIVNKKDQTITFTLSGTGVVGDTLDLSATTSSMLEVTYSSSNSTIAEVGTGTNAGKLILKAKALDSVTITASQAGDARYLAATDVTQNIIVSEKALGVDVKNTDIRVWPNPVATQLNISSGSRGKLTITLRNLAGQKLQEGEFEGKGQMDVSHLPAGVYLLHIRTAEETTSYLIYKE